MFLNFSGGIDFRRPWMEYDVHGRHILTFKVCSRNESVNKSQEYLPRNVISMLGHRLRRWPNTGPTLARCLVFAV